MTGHTYEILLAAGILSPFISFWLLVFFGAKMGKPASGWFGVVLGMGVPLVCATIVLISWWGEDPASRAQLSEHAYRVPWATLGTVPATVGIKLDSLTVAMYFMVAFVAFWIFVFSLGYMSGHSDEVDGKCMYHRFFAYLSLFGFSMLGLVASSSLLFLFIFWELVGLCSYLLIGFYFDKGFASEAGMKAFITNRVGDFGFLIGLMLVFFQLHTLDLDQAAGVFASQAAHGTGIFASNFTLFGASLATIMGIGLFCGAMGKSAQFPLHVWLPDAMAGPTPVSALIHAATMVAAGVYLVARVFRLMTPEALLFVALIGCLTLTLMALVAIVQVDIKKCLAYSTLSQLGYMVFGMGCGAWIAALFHLIMHAFFKAMLFLCSGQVIEGCHHEQDMRKMGGLRKKMPVTCWTFFVGVLAISGAGIVGLEIGGKKIGLGGFFSKDEILAVAWTRAYDWDYEHHQMHGDHGGGHDTHAQVEPDGEAQVVLASFGQKGVDNQGVPADSKQPMAAGAIRMVQHHEHGSGHGHAHAGPGHADPADSKAAIFADIPPLPKWMFWLALITAYVTPFYMMRCWWMTFMGKPRDEEVHHHAHEIPLMYVPLIVLAVGTFVTGYGIFRDLIADAAPAATDAARVLATDGATHTAAMTAAHHWLMWGVGFAFIVGFAAAWAIYRRGLDVAESIRRAVAPLHFVLEKKYFFDEVYGFVWVKGCVLVSRIARLFDTYVIDLVFDLAAAITERLAAFSGLILDNHGVDGVVNGIADSSKDFGEVVCKAQTGKIRNYVLFATAVATVVVICVLIWWVDASAPLVAVAESTIP